MKVIARNEKKIIETYELGKSEINPVFFEKRVYQGSSGKVYPVPFIDKVYDHKIAQAYDYLTLENDFVRLAMLPEIGGRIFEAQDKTNEDYDFFYRQKVIKPALVGLAGPWISGGVEFNWPQHHRPGTYLPTDVFIEEEEDGAKTIWMSEYDPMYRLKGMHGIRIRPDSALIELRGRLFNRTPLTQTFLWWANVAVEVHDQYQSFFPPDVHYVADHAVRAMSSFPEAENYYYGIPYHERPGANDLRKYENINVPTSYMVCDTRYDFFGGYDFKADGGFVHVANRHIAPGKKQWTWGSDEFGRAWDRELTDESGPYFELMAGVYTDNQPDFTYLQPFETKTFSQYWWSYKKLGPVQNANKELAVKCLPKAGNRVEFGIASSAPTAGLQIVLNVGGMQTSFKGISTSPSEPWQHEMAMRSGDETDLSIAVYDAKDHLLISYKHQSKPDTSRNRNEAFEPLHAEAVKTPTELELIGEHLELYRHPTRYPEPYWEKALSEDPMNYHAHIALGKGYLKNTQLDQAGDHLGSAVRILTTYHPNPSTGEAHYFLGLCRFRQERFDEAYSLFYKASWSYAWRSAAFYFLAKIDLRRRDYATALEHLEASLDTNRQNNSAFVLKAIALSELGRENERVSVLKSLLKTDPLYQWAKFELALANSDFRDFLSSSRNDAQTVIDIAFEYAEVACYDRAIRLLEVHHDNEIPDCAVPNPMGRSQMTHLILSNQYYLIGQETKCRELIERACSGTFDYFFPSRTQEVLLLEWLLKLKPDCTLAAYGLGNYYFNAKRHEDAIRIWENAVEYGCKYGTLYRNLGIAHWNAHQDGDKARTYFEQAIALAGDDARIQFEYDQLRKKLNDSPTMRLRDILALGDMLYTRDDFSVELAALYNLTGQYENALKLLSSRQFHPWEGGEGQVLKQYSYASLQLGKRALADEQAEDALRFFEQSLETPDNLGEKFHPLQAVAHINYWKGMACRALLREREAKEYFTASAEENGDFIDMAVSSFSELTLYKALSLRELGREVEAMDVLTQMYEFASKKLNETAKIDYFATSLPLLLVFEDDIQKRNTIEAYYLMGLAELGRENIRKSKEFLHRALDLNVMHLGAHEHLNMIESAQEFLVK
ncbi:MAG: DUF5107 domain-containing protein [Bacteroidota bacterium]